MTLDLHLDSPWQFTKRGDSVATPTILKAGGLEGVVYALYLSESLQTEIGVEASWKAIERQIDFVNQRHEELGKMGIKVFMALEGGRLINQNLDKLETLAKAGIRYMTLTHNKNTAWADSATDQPLFNGLSLFGMRAVKACERFKVLVDVSHTSDKTAEAVLKITKKPVIASHSGVRNLIPHPRNLSDDLIKRIAETGGLIGIPFAKNFIGPNWMDVANHIDYVVQKVGIESVAIGSDLDGAVMVKGAETALNWRTVIWVGLTKKGYKRDEIEKVAGENALRLFEKMRS